MARRSVASCESASGEPPKIKFSASSAFEALCIRVRHPIFQDPQPGPRPELETNVALGVRELGIGREDVLAGGVEARECRKIEIAVLDRIEPGAGGGLREDELAGYVDPGRRIGCQTSFGIIGIPADMVQLGNLIQNQ